MAQTLEELFKSKQLQSQGGKTAEAAYDIRNSKNIRISSNNVLLDNTGFAAARLLRKKLGARKSETLLEEEVTGIRIIRGLSTPVIYGNEVTRITLRTTPMLEKMKASTSGEVGSGGLIGGKIAQARDFVNSKLGIPTGATPTYVVTGLSDKTKYPKLITQSRMVDLESIRTGAQGSLLGKFLKGLGGGDLKTIGKQALGALINLGKSKLRGKLFGERSTTGFNPAEPTKNGARTTFNYGSLDNATGVTISTDPLTNQRDAKGLMYSKTFNLKTTDTDAKLNFYDATDEGGIAAKTAQVVKRRFDLPAMLNFPATEIILPLYSELFNRVPRQNSSDGVNSDGTLAPTATSTFPNVKELKDAGENNSVLLGKNGLEKHEDIIELSIERPIQSYYEKIKNDPKRTPKFLETDTRGMYTAADAVNKLAVGKSDDKIDFVTLRFSPIGGGSLVQFRATISGLSETLSPSWDSNKFIGSPFNYYTYTGIDRSVSFNFKIYSLNEGEHQTAWAKLDKLTDMVYPLKYSGISVVPPLISFTLGDMYHAKAGFIQSLSYTIDDTYPWEVEKKGMILPMIVDVAVTVQFIENKTEATKVHYSFKPTT